MTNIKHEIWEDPDGLTMLCMAGELGAESRVLLEPGSKVIQTFYASSHFDAMTKYYEFMGWGAYDSDFEIDKDSFDLDNLMDRAKLIKLVDEILWTDWDPLDVNEIAPKDEYQAYVSQIVNLILKDSSVPEIAERLYKIETLDIGLLGDRGRCLKVANELKKRHANNV